MITLAVDSGISSLARGGTTFYPFALCPLRCYHWGTSTLSLRRSWCLFLFAFLYGILVPCTIRPCFAPCVCLFHIPSLSRFSSTGAASASVDAPGACAPSSGFAWDVETCRTVKAKPTIIKLNKFFIKCSFFILSNLLNQNIFSYFDRRILLLLLVLLLCIYFLGLSLTH
jgi:hypothetical protein